MEKYLSAGGIKMKRRALIISLTMIIVLTAMPCFVLDANANGWHFGMSATNGGFNTISSGAFFSMAVKDDSSLWAWGWNAYGQLGDGTTEDRESPVRIMDDVASVLAIRKRAFAIKTDGSLWAWGFGIIGDGVARDWRNPPALEPVKILDSVVSVTAYDTSETIGNYSAFAIRTDGSLWAWGVNDLGQLGDGTITQRDENWNIIEDTLRLSPIKIMDDVASVVTGNSRTFAIQTDGSLWSWGSTRFGLLGCGAVGDPYDGRFDYRATPVKVMDNVVSVSSGWGSTMVVKTDGSLWTWGIGQLGDGIERDWDEPLTTPVKIMDDVASVSGNRILKTDGSLWSWGGNSSGRVGDGTVTTYDENWNIIDNNERLSPVKVLDAVESIVEGSGSSYTMVIRTDGSLWAWGSNLGGQLGDGTTSAYVEDNGNVFYYLSGGETYETYIDNDRYSPVKILDSIEFILSFGIYDTGSTMVIRSDGSLWAWGSNWRGQLGDGTTERRYSPVKIMDGVKLPSNVVVNYPESIIQPEESPEPSAEPDMYPTPPAETDVHQEPSEENNNSDNASIPERRNTALLIIIISGIVVGCGAVAAFMLHKKRKGT
jgi:alpha-tubulin suppressor-like RCC1 family protein